MSFEQKFVTGEVLQQVVQGVRDKIKGEIVDNLESTDADKPLSANQGKVLNTSKLDKTGGTVNGNLNVTGDLQQAGNDVWHAGNFDPSEYSPTSHTHDDRYYTESEIDSKLNTKLDKDGRHEQSSDTITSMTGYEKAGSGEVLPTDNLNQAIGKLEVKADTALDIANSAVPKANIINNLTTGGADSVLSAEQGKALNDTKLDKTGGTVSGNLNVTGSLQQNGNDVATISTVKNGIEGQLVGGEYTSDGGIQPPSYVPSGKVRFNMMNNAIAGNSEFKDWILMDTYKGPDVPYVTGIGVAKSSIPRAFIMTGQRDGDSWGNSYELWSTNNFNPNTKWTIVTPSADTASSGIEVSTGGLYIRHDNELNFKSTSAEYLFNYRHMGGEVITKFKFCAGNATPNATIECGSIVSNGTIVSNNDITAFSDKRLKENITKIDNALDIVNNINGYRYQMKADETHKTRVGVIAQEIQKVLPEVVVKNENDMLSVNYGAIVSVLIEAIKEQQQQIEELRGVVYGTTR